MWSRLAMNLLLHRPTPCSASMLSCSASRPSSSSTSVKSSSSSVLRFQHRTRTLPTKKKARPASQVPDKDRWSVVGYSTADGYDLLTLADRLEEQGLYQVEPLVGELLPVCLYARAKYRVDEEEEGSSPSSHSSKDMFFFENGSVVFWSVPELERDAVLSFVRRVAESDSYSEATINEEAEMMVFSVEEGKSDGGASLKPDGEIKLPPAVDASSSPAATTRLRLQKYAFSDGIAASVKLGALESDLDRIVDSIEHLSEDLKRGKSVKMSRKEVLQKSGEIFALRHVLNLSSDLLDTPDFYWDREDLERLYHSTCVHLAIGKRTRVLNEKLTHCCELMDLITNHLNDEHHVRLEWFIIVLILIEVVFEVLHFVERYA